MDDIIKAMEQKQNYKLKKPIPISFYVILFLLMSFFSSLFLGKLVSSSIMYSLESPYHFEKVLAEVVDINFNEAHHNKYWLDNYNLIAEYIDEETGLIYKAYLLTSYKDKSEAESHIGEKAFILIDREYKISVGYTDNAKSGGIPIDIIVYSIMLVFFLTTIVICIIKLTKINKKYFILISIFTFLMFVLAGYVAYVSFDMNYLNQLINLK